MAMSRAAKGIMAGLKDALAYAEGKPNGCVVHHVQTVDVKAAREKRPKVALAVPGGNDRQLRAAIRTKK